MGHARDPVQLVQVVGQDPGGETALAQGGQRIHAVVDSTQQHGLVEQLHAGPAQAAQGGIDAARIDEPRAADGDDEDEDDSDDTTSTNTN